MGNIRAFYWYRQFSVFVVVYRLKVDLHSVEAQMGCLTLLLYPFAIWGFSELGWISLTAGASVWSVALWSLVCIIVVDFLSWGVKFLVKLASIPASLVTMGIAVSVIEGVFKYFGLALASHWSALFTIPWIFSPFWWQALLIGIAFAVIGAMWGTKTKIRYTHRTTTRTR